MVMEISIYLSELWDKARAFFGTMAMVTSKTLLRMPVSAQKQEQLALRWVMSMATGILISMS